MKSVCLFLCSFVLTAFWAVIEATSRTTSDPFVPEIAGILCIVVGVFCGAMKTRYIKAVLLTQWLTCFSVMLYLWCFHIAEETPHNLFLVLLSQIPTSPMLPWGLRGANLFFSPGVTPALMLAARILSAVLIISLFSGGFLAGRDGLSRRNQSL